VIQRLFATGLSLQGITRLVHADPAAAEQRIRLAVDDLDLTVKHIRTAIFGLEGARTVASGVRARVLGIASESAGALGFEPRVLIDGPVDMGVSEGVANDLVATLREALSNVARHAQATRTDVEVVADDTMVTLRVVDDGVGLPEPRTEDPEGHGLRSMATRAERRGGSLTLSVNEPEGVVLEWRVPRSR
jgi:signal transduction histidine kinase